jgi:hypothetical protein
MKSIIFTFVLAFAAVFSLQAQNKIENAGFELWDKPDPALDLELPAGWLTSDLFNLFFGADIPTKGVTKTTDKKSGTYAIKIRPDTSNVSLIPGGPAIKVTLPSFIFTADLNSDGTGIGITKRPAGVLGFYKLINPDKDTASIFTSVTSWDSKKNEQIEVGMIDKNFTNAANYTAFNFPIVYDPALKAIVADTIVIGFNAGGEAKPSIKTQLFLDDLGFSYPLSTKDIENTIISVYPNPVMENIFLDVTTIPTAKMVVITNIEGKIISETLVEDSLVKVPMIEYPSGTYIYQVLDKEKQQLTAGKLEKH